MPSIAARIFADDEELGKKDDDHRPGRYSSSSNLRAPLSSTFQSWRTPPPRRRRILIVAICVVLLYFFFKNMPADLLPVAERFDRRVPGQTYGGIPIPQFTSKTKSTKELRKEREELEKQKRRGQAQQGADKDPSSGKVGMAASGGGGGGGGGGGRGGGGLISTLLGGSKLTSPTTASPDGEITFPFLPATLQAVGRSLGYSVYNRNVLFVAANPQSASRMILMACEMARWNRNAVHFAYFGRDSINLDDIKADNSVTKACEVFWHDARPYHAELSSNARFRVAVQTALSNFHIFAHPQVYISDERNIEEHGFVGQIQERATSDGSTLIQLPDDAPQRLLWITRLDSAALASWHNIYVDIVIHATSTTSDSLIRLLKSISSADYFGTRYPHLTIELPPEIDGAIQHYLDRFIWPPWSHSAAASGAAPPHTSRLTLRRRLASTKPISPLEASARLVESFYPSRPEESHVVVLDPHLQLSRLYYHYLFFHTLDITRSMYSKGTYEADHIMGIALDIPTHHVEDDQKTFIAPSPESNPPWLIGDGGNHQPTGFERPPFLWQAPHARGALFFGSKWQELHSFLSLRMSHPAPNSARTKRILPPSVPAFLEPVFELMKLRGYVFYYPHPPAHVFAGTANAETSFQPEFETSLDPSSTERVSSDQPIDPNDPYLPADSTSRRIRPPPRDEHPLASSRLHDILPNDGDLPELRALPLLDAPGRPVTAAELAVEASAFAEEFRSRVGGCPDSVGGVGTFQPQIRPGSAEDLFCETDARGKRVQAFSLDPDREWTYYGQRAAREEEKATAEASALELQHQYESAAMLAWDAPDVAEEEKKSMDREYETHLQRQAEQG